MADLTDITAHRPYPLPDGPWIQSHHWTRMLFAHWPVDVEAIQAKLPPGLELDTCDGQAWVSITPFRVCSARLRGTPAIPFLSEFPEVDIRTYVLREGKPAVFYFTMDAPHPLITAAARLVYSMPYRGAEVTFEERGAAYYVRDEPGGGPAVFEATYGPEGETFQAEPGSLEYFLTERYALFNLKSDGGFERVEIHRLPWPLQRGRAEILQNTLAAEQGVSLPDREPLLHFTHGTEVLVWPPSEG